MKALEASHSSQFKCIYIDPPYNTGSIWADYDDGIEHSLWLRLMRDRFELLRSLLREDGTLWVHLDDNEAHYAKVVLDEIFGRRNFISNVVWQKSYAVRSNAEFISSSHEHILVYGKNKAATKLNRFRRGQKQEERYANPDGDLRGPWQSVTLTISLVGGARGRQFAKTGKSDNIYEVVSPAGARMLPPPNRCWSRSKVGFGELDAENRIWWGAKGDSAPRLKMFLSEADEGIIPTSLWADGADFGHNQDGIRELRALGLPDFPTPKPEKLIRKIIELASDKGDWVLDSFSGSGTTGAVAHKMARKWVMVELGGHCETLIVPRLNKVINGEDPGGITDAVGWKGGGGYRYYKLAPSLLEKDQFDNWVISKSYNAEMLAEAMCRHFSFTYAPSTEHYWTHGYSSETDFIYVTTNSLTHEQLATISDEVGPERTLLICCKAFQGGNADAFSNLTIRKIPGAILDRCEWGKDDYSLKIEALPLIEDELEEEEDEVRRRKPAGDPNQPGLFNGDEELEA